MQPEHLQLNKVKTKLTIEVVALQSHIDRSDNITYEEVIRHTSIILDINRKE